jgi:hypothetical protein
MNRQHATKVRNIRLETDLRTRSRGSRAASQPSRQGDESMMCAYRDIGIEQMVPTELIVAKFKEGEKKWHFNYDG